MGRKHSQDHNDNLVLFNNKKEQINGAATQKRQKVGVDERIINPNSFLNVEPKTEKQKQMMTAFFENQHIVACGSAGTGKSYIALYMALLDVVVNKKAKRINIIRSPLSVNHQGFLPGTLEEKEAVYERPYVDIVNFLFDNDEAYYELKRVGMINFMTTSYIRGLTWNDTIVIADEVQNMLWEEINTIATRCGPNTRLMFLGDVKQDDLTVSKRYQQSGINTMIKVATSMQSFDVVEFGPEDIVRDEFVKAWIIACELNHV